MNNFTKISGWILVLAGLSVICFTIWYSYNIFSGKADIPDIFQAPKEEEKASPLASDQESMIQQTIKDQMKGLLPFDFLNRSLNLAVWAMLALILMSAGSRISDIGVKLIKAGEEKNQHAQQ